MATFSLLLRSVGWLIISYGSYQSRADQDYNTIVLCKATLHAHCKSVSIKINVFVKHVQEFQTEIRVCYSDCISNCRMRTEVNS